MNTLVIDIGGSNVKIWRTGFSDKLKFESGKDMTPKEFAQTIKDLIGDWHYDRVSIGYPGDVLLGQPTAEPYNLGEGWVGYDFAKLFGAPVRIMNDACMQALGSYEGGRMLFIGLGTSMGTAYMIDGKIIPLALGHLQLYEGETLEEHLSRAGLKEHGAKTWERAVYDAVKMLKAAFLVDYVVLGGGHSKKLDELPDGCRRGSNEMAYLGGVKMWEDETPVTNGHLENGETAKSDAAKVDPAKEKV